MAGSEERGESPASGSSLDEHLRVYLRDESLWPVLIVVIAVAVTLGAALLSAAVVLGNLAAWGAVALLALISLDVVQRDLRARRLGIGGRLVLLLWVASAGAAAAVIAFGWV